MFRQLQGIKTKLFADITSVPEILQPSHLPGLDGLRGVSIIIVIVGHLLWENNILKFIGSVGVDTFFVISGFLITTLLLKEKVNNGFISLKSFYIRRALRIMPVAYLFILVLIILNIIFNLNITFKSFATAILYVKNIPFRNSGEWYTGHFWSLSVEEQFYLIFPILIVRYFNKYTLIILCVIFFIPLFEIVGYNNLFNNQSNHAVHLIVFFIINVFGKGSVEILIGSLASLLTFKKIINFNQFKFNYWFSIIVFIIAFLIDTVFYMPIVSSLIFAFCITIVILNNLSQKTFFKIVLESRILTKIGLLSYSIYIWQQLFVFDQPWAKSFKYSNSILLNLIALTAVVYASYHLYELQFLKLKKRFKSV